MKKWAPYILIALLATTILIIRTCQRSSTPEPKPKVVRPVQPKDPAAQVNRDRGFDRRISFLEYSNHARCRMKCRGISMEEVQEIMEAGKINYNKSDLKNARCPRYALEGVTDDNQRVRIVFAQCNESTVVVTAIDLETEFSCDCPGDDDKYINRKR